MKKLLLLLIILTTLTNISYASFPIVETVHFDVVDMSSPIVKQHKNSNIWLFIAIGCSLLGFLPFWISPSYGTAAILIMLNLLAFIFFLIWTTSKKWAKWFWLAFLVLGLLGVAMNDSEHPFFNR